MTQLILASSSPYRKELLARLSVEFECISPDIDESRQPDEAASDYVVRLAQQKAEKIGQRHADALIIGSDQCCVNGDQILGKPKDKAHAIQQLEQASGKQIEFLTGVHICHPQGNWQRQWLDSFVVEFRQLSRAEIERYIDKEQPLNCAGSFKSEKLGISLCESMRGNDPTALVGLPLIKVAACLREFGMEVP